MVVKLVVGDPKSFKESVEAINTIVDEGVFVVDESGMKLRAIDPSQIAMIDFYFPNHAFQELSVESEEQLGLNLNDFNKIMKRARSDDILILEKEESHLKVTFKGKTTRHFTVPLIDIAGEIPKEPQIEFAARVRVLGDVFKEGLKDASLVSPYVTLQITQDGFYMSATGDKGEVIVEVKKDEDVVLEHDVKEEARAMFQLDHLQDFVKSASSDSIITVDLRTDAPVRIKYPIGNADVTYYLAPRIEGV